VKYHGTVIRGDGRGTQLGFPTINLQLSHSPTPPVGVFAVTVELDGQRYCGVAHCGARPTFAAEQFVVELHLFDFAATTAVGTLVSFTLGKKLRGVRKFADPAALVAQIARDIAAARC